MGIRILTIDDDRELLSLLERVLAQEFPSYQITSITSAQEALEKLEAEEFDAVVCDYHLGPGKMNGLELLEWLREGGNDIPFVMFTGRSREEVAIRALNLGADLYLRKDEADFDSLFAELGHHLRKSVDMRRTESALYESEERLRGFYESSMDGIVSLDSKGCFIHCNKAFIEMTGYNFDELLGLSFTEITPTTWQTQFEAIRQEIITKKSSRVFEQEILSKDGTPLPVTISIWHLGERPADQFVAWLIVRDMSWRKRAEQQLRLEEERFKRVFLDSPNAIALFNKDGRLVDANSGVLTAFGVDDILMIRGYSLFDDPDLPQDVKDSLQRGESVSFQRNYDFNAVRERNLYPTQRTGKTRFNIIAIPFGIDADGSNAGYILQMLELPDSEESEKIRRDTEHRFRILFDNTPVALAFVTIDSSQGEENAVFRFSEINRTFEEMTGISKESLIGKDFAEVHKLLKIPIVDWYSAFKHVLSTPLPYLNEIRNETGDAYAVTIYRPYEDVIVIAVADISDQASVYDQIRKERTELSEFAHQMKHDITNSLLKIRAYLKLIKTSDMNEIENMQSLIHEMIEVLNHSAELADAGLIVKEDQTNLDELVRATANRHIPETIEYHQNQLPMVVADETKLIQVFSNIFENAVNHGNPTRIEVGCDTGKSKHVVYIQNDGEKLPKDVVEVIHNHHFIAKSGYGLRIVKRIVSAHGWNLRIADGEATRFEIVIPIEGGL